MNRVLSAIHRSVLLAGTLAIALAAPAFADDSIVAGPDLAAPDDAPLRLPAPESQPLAVLPPSEELHTPSEVTPLPETPSSNPTFAEESEGQRSEQLEFIAQQADQQTRHGYELAGRGAYFAARAEFLGALRLVAQGLDAEQKTDAHVRALNAGIAAIKESEDFLPSNPRLVSADSLDRVIKLHATPVLKDDAKTATPLTATRSYLTYAQQQCAKAVGREIAGSMALHALGKLHATMAERSSVSILAPESKAVVYYQAALLCYPKNHMAANDLGVLLARSGRYADAKSMLERSAAACPQSTSWQNLAVIYRHTNQPHLAAQSLATAATLRKQELARRPATTLSSNGAVQWLDAQTFAQSSHAGLTSPPGATPTLAQQPQTAPQQPAAARTPVPRSTLRAPAAAAPTQPSTPASASWFSSNASRPTPNSPAPTPAAAQRMSNRSSYQR